MKLNDIKLSITFITAFIAEQLGVASYGFGIFCVLMALDYITGLMAAKKTGTISSSIGVFGIFKKVTYGIIIWVAVMIDRTLLTYAEMLGISIGIKGIFGLIVTLWFITNEAISILENAVVIESRFPPFIKKFLETAKEYLNNQGENTIESIPQKKE